MTNKTNSNPTRNKTITGSPVPHAAGRKLRTETGRDGSQIFKIPLVDLAPEKVAKRLAEHFEAELLFYKCDQMTGDITVLFTDGRKMTFSPQKLPPLLKGKP